MSTDDSDSDPESMIDTPEMEAYMKGRRVPQITDRWLTELLIDYHKRNRNNNKEESSLADEKKDEEDSNNEELPDIILGSSTIDAAKYEYAETALSDIYRMLVEYQYEGKNHVLHLIVKQLPNDPFSRFFVKEAQFDIREMKFYNEVVPNMRRFQKKHGVDFDLPIPECYYPGDIIDKETVPDIVLILEDLKARGYVSSHFSTGLDKREAISALQAIAKIHSLSLAMKIQYGDLNAKYPFLFQTDKATDSYQMLLERGLPHLGIFLESKPHMKNVFRSIDEIRARSKQLISSLLVADGPLALLTHTDFWCNNLLFQQETGQCAIVDWQMIAYSRPTNDVALLILSSLPTAVRRDFTAELLDEYWKALTDYTERLGVKIEDDLGYGKHDLLKDYRKSQLLAILLCIGSVDIALGNYDTEKRLLDLLEDLYNDQVFSEQMVNECIGI